MTNYFELNIYSSDKVFFKGNVTSLIIPTIDGDMGILANHENMVVAIETGELHFKINTDEWTTAAVSKGFAEILNNTVYILVDTAESPDEIDIRRAQEAKERAEERLRQHKSMHEYYSSQASLARAMNRLKTSKNKNWKI